MRIRKASRLFIINENHQVLLFQFSHTSDALAGQTYWATIGGAVENGESFEAAACRELYEEVGIVRQDIGTCITTRNFEMMLPSSEIVIADERFFIVFIKNEEMNTQNWTEHEKEVIHKSYWWTLDELNQTKEIVFPHDIPNILLENFPELLKN